MKTASKQSMAFLAAVLLTANALAASVPECIVPSKPGGGFDLTCKLVRQALQEDGRKPTPDAALRIGYLPGGIGAVAWSMMMSQRRAEPGTLVAFSSGSLLNLALGKFGQASAADMRWVAGVGTDYGMIAVRDDSPYKTLRDLADALKKNPEKVTIGAGGTIGSQDWLKMALIAKQAGINPKALRLVAFEGGGESFTALRAGHVQAVSGDASEASLHAFGGNGSEKVRILAILSDARLPGALAKVPTAREQGFDVTWPIIRGVYLGPDVSNADYDKWVTRFNRLMAAPSFDGMRTAYGLYPFAMTGAAFADYVRRSVDNYSRQARELGLVR